MKKRKNLGFLIFICLIAALIILFNSGMIFVSAQSSDYIAKNHNPNLPFWQPQDHDLNPSIRLPLWGEKDNICAVIGLDCFDVAPFECGASHCQKKDIDRVLCGNDKLAGNVKPGGNCPEGTVCDYLHTPHTCVTCTPEGISVTCAGRTCGTKQDNCGNPVDCGTCPTGQTCNANGQCDAEKKPLCPDNCASTAKPTAQCCMVGRGGPTLCSDDPLFVRLKKERILRLAISCLIPQEKGVKKSYVCRGDNQNEVYEIKRYYDENGKLLPKKEEKLSYSCGECGTCLSGYSETCDLEGQISSGEVGEQESAYPLLCDYVPDGSSCDNPKKKLPGKLLCGKQLPTEKVCQRGVCVTAPVQQCGACDCCKDECSTYLKKAELIKIKSDYQLKELPQYGEISLDFEYTKVTPRDFGPPIVENIKVKIKFRTVLVSRNKEVIVGHKIDSARGYSYGPDKYEFTDLDRFINSVYKKGGDLDSVLRSSHNGISLLKDNTITKSPKYNEMMKNYNGAVKIYKDLLKNPECSHIYKLARDRLSEILSETNPEEAKGQLQDIVNDEEASDLEKAIALFKKAQIAMEQAALSNTAKGYREALEALTEAQEFATRGLISNLDPTQQSQVQEALNQITALKTIIQNRVLDGIRECLANKNAEVYAKIMDDLGWYNAFYTATGLSIFQLFIAPEELGREQTEMTDIKAGITMLQIAIGKGHSVDSLFSSNLEQRRNVVANILGCSDYTSFNDDKNKFAESDNDLWRRATLEPGGIEKYLEFDPTLDKQIKDLEDYLYNNIDLLSNAEKIKISDDLKYLRNKRTDQQNFYNYLIDNKKSYTDCIAKSNYLSQVLAKSLCVPDVLLLSANGNIGTAKTLAQKAGCSTESINSIEPYFNNLNPDSNCYESEILSPNIGRDILREVNLVNALLYGMGSMAAVRIGTIVGKIPGVMVLTSGTRSVMAPIFSFLKIPLLTEQASKSTYNFCFRVIGDIAAGEAVGYAVDTTLEPLYKKLGIDGDFKSSVFWMGVFGKLETFNILKRIYGEATIRGVLLKDAKSSFELVMEVEKKSMKKAEEFLTAMGLKDKVKVVEKGTNLREIFGDKFKQIINEGDLQKLQDATYEKVKKNIDNAIKQTDKEIAEQAKCRERYPEPPETPGCFLAGTQIQTAEGSYKNIKDILKGENVKAFDISKGKPSNAEVTTTFVRPETKYKVVEYEVEE